MAEVTDAGYILKTQNEYFDEETQKYLDIDTSWNLDPSTIDGSKIANDSEVFANLDEAGQKAYNSKDPNKAKGVELDVLSSLTGHSRNLGTSSNVPINITGVPGTIISQGSTVQSSFDDTLWTVDATVTIGGGGTITGNATAIERGATEASINTINIIVDAISGWQTVNNSSIAIVGTNKQTDNSLRLSRALTVGRPGNNQIDSMLGELGSVSDVRLFRIYENKTTFIDANGLLSHSIAVIVDGGSDSDIARAIFNKLTLGVFMHNTGNPVVVEVASEIYPQNTQNITFNRPLLVPMVLVVTILDDGSLPASVLDEIKQAVFDYSRGELVPVECGFRQTGYGIGDDVNFSSMYTPVNNVIGSYGNSSVQDMLLNGASSNVSIGFNELSSWSLINISVVLI